MEDCSNLVELIQPRGKHALTRSIRFGFLGDGTDGEMHMIGAQAAGHNPTNIRRLPTALPCLMDLAALVRADQLGDKSRRDAWRSTCPFVPPADERSQLGSGLVPVPEIELFEDLDEHVLDPIIRLDRLGPCSGLRRRLQSGTDALAAASAQFVVPLIRSIPLPRWCAV